MDSAMVPAASNHGPNTSPASRRAAPSAAISGRNDGPGMCTPSGGPSCTTAGQLRLGPLDVALVEHDASRSQYSRPIARPIAPSTSVSPPKTTPRNSRKAPTAAKIGANDGPGMWTPTGGRGWMRAFPRRAGAARAIRQNWITMTTRTSAKIATGSSAISPPQSGMTNWDMNSRMLVQRSSSIRGPRSAAGCGGRSHGHSFGDPATRT